MADASQAHSPTPPQHVAPPDWLRHQRWWLRWVSGEPLHEGGKRRKIPLYANGNLRGAGGALDTPEDLAQLVTWDEAWAAHLKALERASRSRLRPEGVGLACVPGSGLVFIDLDNCRDPETGELNDFASDALDAAAGAYVEVTPSGCGLRIIGRGDWPTIVAPERGVEVYVGGRFVTWTGRAVEGDAQAALQPPLLELLQSRAGPVAAPAGGGYRSTPERREGERAGAAEEVPPELMPHLLLALNRLDADDYAVWTRVGMQLKTAAGVGFDLWDEWSKGSEKYPGREELESKWNSLRPRDLHWWGILRAAAEADPEFTVPSYKVLARYREKVAGEALGAALRERTELSARVRAEAKAIGEGDPFKPLVEQLTVDQMLERLVLLSDGSRVLDLLNPKGSLGYEDASRHYAASTVEVQGKTTVKRVRALQLWQESPGRLTAMGSTFAPGQPVFTADPHGRLCVNTFTGWGRRVHREDLVRMWYEHFRYLFRDRVEDFLDFAAHIEQRPGELPHTCWLHVSDHQGTGRNLGAGALARVWAGHVALCVDMPGLLGGGFNGVLAGKVLGVVDEIHEGGSDRWSHAERFKELVTSQTRVINPKYGRQQVEFNCCRWVIFSNHREALPVGEHDRRVEAVINPDPPRGEEYYARLAASLSDPELGPALGQWLRDRDISRFAPGRHARLTEDKVTVAASGRSPLVGAVAEYLEESRPRELFVMSELEQAAGVSATGRDAGRMKVAISGAGLIPLKRMRRPEAGGAKVRLYTHRDAFVRWEKALDDPGFEIPGEHLPPRWA